MNNQNVARSFQQALLQYEDVINELNRPKRDVVMVAACEMIKRSMSDFLHAYLEVKGKPLTDDASLVELYNESIKIDTRFDQLDMRTIACLEEEHADTCQRCLESGWINKCEQVMARTKDLVMELLHEKAK